MPTLRGSGWIGVGPLPGVVASAGVLPAGPTLSALALSTSLQSGVVIASGTITGATGGSSIASNVTGLSVNSGARTYSFDGSAIAGTTANGLVETLAGATNSPRPTPVTVAAAGAAVAAPFVDRFEAPTGKLSTRSGWQVTARTTLPSHANALDVVTAGSLSGSVGGVGAGAMGLHTDALSAVVTTRLAALPGAGYLAHQGAISGDGMTYLRTSITQSVSGNQLTGFVSITPVTNNVGGTGQTIGLLRLEAGDVTSMSFFDASSTRYGRFFVNGRRAFNVDFDLTANGPPATGGYGVTGNVPAQSIDSIVVADPVTQQSLMLYAPNRIVQVDASGNLVWKLACTYTQTLAGLKYRVINDATGAAVSGHDGAAVTAFAATGGIATFGIQAAPAIPAGGVYHVEVYQDGLTGGDGTSLGMGPSQRGGDVIFHTGQSNSVNANGVTSTTTSYPAPANSHKIDGTNTSVPELRRQAPIAADTPMAAEANALIALTGRPVAIVQTGLGGTTAAQRAPGTALHTALLDGIDHAGGRVRYFIDDGGESDQSTPTTWKPAMDSIHDSADAKLGYAAPVIVTPIGSVIIGSATDAAVETMRRTQWKATQDTPARYKLGPYKMDLEHQPIGTDAAGLHYTNQAYADLRVREILAAAKLMGLAAFDPSGPSIVSAAKVDANTIAVTISLNGWDGLEIANATVNGDYRGGLRFATASTFASPVSPTGAAIGAVSGGQAVITYSFTGSPFAGAAYVSGPYGKNPFNPTNSQTINENWAAQASILRGTRSGQKPAAIQPFYSPSGDYVVTP